MHFRSTSEIYCNYLFFYVLPLLKCMIPVTLSQSTTLLSTVVNNHELEHNVAINSVSINCYIFKPLYVRNITLEDL